MHIITKTQRNRMLFILLTICLLPAICFAKPNPSSIPVRYSSINQFINQVWSSNPEIQAARADVAKSDAEYAQSKQAIYNPVLELDGENVHNEPEDNTYTAGFNQTIDLQNKRQAHTQVGEQQLIAAKASLATQQLNLATKALTALVQYRTAQHIVELANQRAQLLKEFKQQNDRKFKSGDIGQHAVDQAAFAYAEAIAQQADEKVALIDARQHLMSIIQMPVGSWPKLPSSLPSPMHSTPEQQQQWLTHLPIIQMYNAQVAIAMANIKLAKTKTHSDPTLKFRGGAENSQLLIGLGLELPLFVRNNYRDLVHAANQQAIANEEIRLNAFREAKATLQGDLSRYQVLYQANQNWQKVAKTGLKNGADLLRRLWSAGELTTADYLVKLKQGIDSQIAGEQLRGKAWVSWVSLMQSSGQLKAWLIK